MNPATVRDRNFSRCGVAFHPASYIAVVLFGIASLLAPRPVLAQHGGGGGGHAGGGGHVGGGGGHVSGGGSAASSYHGVSRSGGHAYVGTPAAGARGAFTSAHAGGRGFNPGSTVWIGARPVHGNPTTGAIGSHLVTSPVLNSRLRSLSAGERGPLVEMFALRRRPHFRGNDFFFFGGGCFDGFFPGFCSFAPGLFGFPFWPLGWDNDGVAPESFGYPFAPSMSDEIDARVENQPQYYQAAPFGYEYQYPPAAARNNEGGSQPEGKLFLLYLKDGSMYALTNYWVADGKLHYVTSYGGENAIEMDLVDVQHTVDVNSKRGVTFVLTPRAAAEPENENPVQSKPPQP